MATHFIIFFLFKYWGKFFSNPVRKNSAFGVLSISPNNNTNQPSRARGK